MYGIYEGIYGIIVSGGLWLVYTWPCGGWSDDSKEWMRVATGDWDGMCVYTGAETIVVGDGPLCGGFPYIR